MEIYAELPYKYYKMLEGGWNFTLPPNVTYTRKSRSCYFNAEDKNEIEELKDYLEELGAPWQVND